jgi:hypothetical protein
MLAFFGVYFPVAIYLKYSYVPQPDPIYLRAGGYAYVAALLANDDVADSADSPFRSPLEVYEDGKPLGPAHSVHQDISDVGHGRFSHWRGLGFIFSTSDNTNPNTNNRRYSFGRTEQK